MQTSCRTACTAKKKREDNNIFHSDFIYFIEYQNKKGLYCIE